MTLTGWITMVASLALVWIGTFWCFRKVLSSPSDEKAPTGYGA